MGQPIVDAYLLSEAQDWIGVALHESCVPLLWKTDPPIMGVTVQADVPLKGGRCLTDGWTLDWPRMVREPVALRDRLRAMVDENVGSAHEPRWQRTWAFFESRFALLEPSLPTGPQVGLPVLQRER